MPGAFALHMPGLCLDYFNLGKGKIRLCDYSDAASCQNLDAVEPLLELAMAQAWNEFRDPSIVNSGGIKDYLDKSGPLLQRSVAAPRNLSHPQSKRNKVRKRGNNVPFVV
jgi:hypothetical protein